MATEKQWQREKLRMGIDTDIAIAERLGVSRQRVAQKREEWEIEARRGGVREAGEPAILTTVGDPFPIDLKRDMSNVPLVQSLRQLLVNTRVEKGWTQGELADKVGLSLTYLGHIETGRVWPKPKWLTRICEELGLEWEIEVPVTIRKVRKRKTG